MSMAMPHKPRTAADSLCDREDNTDKLSAAKAAQETVLDFEEIVSEHKDRIARLVYRLLGWSGDAEDVVQEVFLRVLKNLKSFRGESSMSTWLTKIAVNTCHSHRRHLRVKLRAFRAMAHDRLQNPSSPPDGAAGKRESLERVRRAVQKLRPSYRDVVVLRYLQEMKTVQVADVLGISPSAVEVRLHRARQQLKGLLADRVGE